MFNSVRLTGMDNRSRRSGFLATVLALVLIASVSGSMAVAAPGAPAVNPAGQSQNVDWMSSDAAAALDVGIDVMVPSWIPEPFSGMAPSVSASGGYYSLYWMISGDAPTYLYIQGEAGAGLPAGSPADLNKELTINASVQGWGAVHDIGIPAGEEAPIYDQVWWIANGVLYNVNSHNMTGTDSLSLANSLIVLQVPSDPAPEPEVPPTEPPVQEEPVEIPQEPIEEPQDPVEMPQEPVEEPQEPVSEPEQAPVVPEEVDEPSVTAPEDPEQGSQDAPPVTTEPTAAPEVSDSDVGTEIGDGSGGASNGQVSTNPAAGESGSPNRSNPTLPSDGTGGPAPPVIGSDGTGGLYDNALPRIRFVP